MYLMEVLFCETTAELAQIWTFIFLSLEETSIFGDVLVEQGLLKMTTTRQNV